MEKRIDLRYQEIENVDELNVDDRQLLEAASEACNRAHAPYSGFHVGCAIRMSTGEIVTGANQENSAYPACVCAETNALGAMVAQYPSIAPVALAVTTKKEESSTNVPTAPCGVCRQQLVEYERRFNQSIRLILRGEQGATVVLDSVESILPFQLTGDDLSAE